MPLHEISKKIYSGERISEQDALELFNSSDLFTIGELANWRNKQINGDRVYFNINRHINPTNVCVFAPTCKFCSYAESVKDSHAYTMELDEILREAEGMEAEGAKELTYCRWLAS